MIHCVVDRGSDGYPTRLVWSSEIQKVGEEAMLREQEKRREEIRQQKKPMACYVEWAKKRGLWR